MSLKNDSSQVHFNHVTIDSATRVVIRWPSLSLARNFQNLLRAVQRLYGIASFVFRVESDEPKTAGPPCVTVSHHDDVRDLAAFLERYTEGFFGGGPGEFTAFG